MGHSGMGPIGSSDGPPWPEGFQETVNICSKCGKVIPLEKQITIPGRESECYDCYKAGTKTICVDFDGVLAQYDGWKGPDSLGEPMPGARDFVQQLSQDHNVVIHTTRDVLAVSLWLGRHNFKDFIHKVTNQKVPAVAYVDDRAVCFRGDFAETMMRLSYFSPWWKEKNCRTCGNFGTDDGPFQECKKNYGYVVKKCEKWRQK